MDTSEIEVERVEFLHNTNDEKAKHGQQSTNDVVPLAAVVCILSPLDMEVTARGIVTSIAMSA